MAYHPPLRSSPERCACGQPLHYPDHDDAMNMRRQVRRLGRTIAVPVDDYVWFVPRHYIALHGLPLLRLTDLGMFYGWKKRRAPPKRRRRRERMT